MSEYNTVANMLADPAKWGKGPGGLTHCDCADTAIEICGKFDPHKTEPMRRALLKAIGIEAPSDTHGVALSVLIWRWNDAPERTHAEVLEAVRKAGI